MADLKTTVTAHYTGAPGTQAMRDVMEVFCNETVRLINYTLKQNHPDPGAFESEVTYGWFQIPEEPGLYAIQVLGPHDHRQVCQITDDLQRTANQGGYPIVVNTLRA